MKPYEIEYDIMLENNIEYDNLTEVCDDLGRRIVFNWATDDAMISWWPKEAFGPDQGMYGSNAEKVWNKDRRTWATRRQLAEEYCIAHNKKWIDITEHMERNYIEYLLGLKTIDDIAGMKNVNE